MNNSSSTIADRQNSDGENKNSKDKLKWQLPVFIIVGVIAVPTFMAITLGIVHVRMYNVSVVECAALYSILDARDVAANRV